MRDNKRGTIEDPATDRLPLRREIGTMYALYVGHDCRLGDKETMTLEPGQVSGTIASALMRRFEGFTVFPPAVGYFDGREESSTVAHVSSSSRAAVDRAAIEIAQALGQECVLVVELGRASLLPG